MRLRLDLPTHWLGPVFLAAAWTVGLAITDDDDPDAVVCGPDTLAAWADRADDLPVFACSLRPARRAVRRAGPARACTTSASRSGPSPTRSRRGTRPTEADLALDAGDVRLTQGELMEAAAAGSVLTDGGRLFSVTNPASPPGIVTVTEPLALRRLAGPRPASRARAVAVDVRRGTRHASTLTARSSSAGQVVGPHSLPEEAWRRHTGARAGVEVEVAGAGLADQVVARSRCALMSLTGITQSKGVRSAGRPVRATVRPATVRPVRDGRRRCPA